VVEQLGMTDIETTFNEDGRPPLTCSRAGDRVVIAAVSTVGPADLVAYVR